MQITTQEITGAVIIHPLGNAEEKAGWTIREVESIPAGNGRLKWDDQTSQLERLPYEAPRPPDELPLWCVKAVVTLMGLRSAVDAAIAAMSDPDRTVVESAWTDGNVLARSSATVNSLGAGLGLTDEQLDDMWQQAASFQV